MPHVIVIDTLSRVLAGGDENAPADMTHFVSNIDKLRRHTDAHIMIVHHSGKQIANGARGHSSLRAATDTEIEVTADDDTGIHVAKITKQRDHQGGQEYAFSLQEVTLGKNDRGRDVTSCIVVEAASSSIQKKKKLTANQAILMDAYSRLIAEERYQALPYGGDYGENMGFICVQRHELREKFCDLYPDDGTNAGRKRFPEAMKALINNKVIGHNKGVVWALDQSGADNNVSPF